MTVIGAWDPRMTYPTGSHVLHAGRSWIARRWSCGEPPGDSASGSPAGSGLAWLPAGAAPVTTDKATMAQAIDERIGRGA